MKKSETKISELKTRLGMERIPSEQFIQFVHNVIRSMPEPWRNAATRAYLEGGSQMFDETTGKPLRTDSRYHIMNEHSRRCFMTLVEFAKRYPEDLEWLIKETKRG